MLLQKECKEVGVSSDVQNEFWSYGEFELVGHRKQTNANCGKFKHFMGCLNVDLHNAVRWFFPDLKKDSVFVKPVYWSCDKPTCPMCYKYGWATREAARMERRLTEASKRFGLVEHIVISVPNKEYGLSLEALRKRAVKTMYNRGVIGGSMIFHGFWYRNRYVARKTGLPVGWFWNPHFHVLGFIGGEGYGKCRSCRYQIEKTFEKCRECNGFEGVTRREFDKDGYIAVVLGKRKTIGGTCWYQLNHSSIKRGSAKSHAATWFGVCSYRKMELINGEDVGIKHKCPLCANELFRVRFIGVFSEVSVSRCGDVLPFYGEDGKPHWEIVVSRKFEDG